MKQTFFKCVHKVYVLSSQVILETTLKNIFSIKKLFFAIITTILMLSQLSAQDAFTEGNIVVLRIGSSTEIPDSTSNTVWLDEYDVSASPAILVQSVQVKSESEELTYGSLQTYGGYMSRSADSLYLTFGGFVDDQPTVALVDGSVNIDLTTRLDASLGMLRGATSLNGDSLWVSFDGDTRQLYYLQRGSSTVSRAVTTGDHIINSPKIYNSKLYYTNEYNYNFDLTTFKITGSTGKLWYLTDDLPTSETKPYQYSYYSNTAYCTDFIIPNTSVVYIADTSATYGIVKAKAEGSTKYGYIGNGDGIYYGLTEYSSDDDSGEIVFYATRKNNSGAYEVIRVTDAGGYASAPIASVEVVATISSGAVLRGIALAPKGGADKLEQTISNFSDTTATNGNDPMVLSAVATSGEAIAYSSTDTMVASVSGSTVTFTGAGETKIIAYQAGNTIYKEVADTISLIVFPGDISEPVAFTEGNIVVLRIGSSTEISDSTSNTVWLDEYDVSASPAILVQSVQVKSESEELTYGSLQTYGGYMSRSADSLYLTFGGFVDDQPTVALVDGSVNIDLTTRLDASLGMLRGATSLNGDSLWVSFDGDTRQLYYLERGSSTVSRAVTTGDHIINSPKIYNSKLYYTNEYNYNFDLTTFKITGATGKLWYLTDDLPTSETKPYQYSYYSNTAYCTDFIIPNTSVVYIADTSATYGIVKAKAEGSTKYGYIGNGDGIYYGLTEYSSDDDSGEIVFYATRKNNSGAYEVIRVTDAGGYASAPIASVEVVATISSGAVLRGIALAPKGGVEKLEQTINNFSDLNLTDEDIDFDLKATTNSGLDLIFGSLDNGVVHVNGNNVHVEAVGSTKIIAFNLGDDNYKAVVDTINVIVSPSTLPEQDISGIEDFTIAYGDTTTLSATAPGGEVSYSSGNNEMVTISGSILTAVGVGSVTVTALQDGGGTYKSTTKEITVTVEKAEQRFNNFEAIIATYKDDDITISPTATSGGPITFASKNTAVVTVSEEGLLHFSGGGTTYIIASQAGNANYDALTDSVIVSVNKAVQSISSFEDITKTYGDGNFALQAMSSSGLDITYSLGTDTVAQISGSTVKIIGAGTTTITASQEGNDSYESADDSVITLSVNRAENAINGDFSDFTATYGDTPIALGATATSGETVTFTVQYDSIAVASGSGSLWISGAGVTAVTATAGRSNNYDEADSTITLTVAKASQAIENFSDITKTKTDADFELTASASSTLDVTYSISDESIATISGNTISIVTVGSAIITASQAGNNNYKAAEDVSVTLTIVDAGLNDVKEYSESILSLYPNPVTNGKLTLVFDPASANARIEIFLLNGIKIYSKEIAMGCEGITIDTEGFSDGQYVLKYWNEDMCVVRQFIK